MLSGTRSPSLPAAHHGPACPAVAPPKLLSRRRMALPLLLAAVLLAGGCSGEVGFERSLAECSDGRDNDGDNRIDCDDPDCRALAHCAGGGDGSLDRGGTDDGAGADPGGETPDGTLVPPDRGADSFGPDGSAGDAVITR